jgi:hypothetical protein
LANEGPGCLITRRFGGNDRTGIIAPERVVFGSMGPGLSSATPVWKGWKWDRLNGERDKRPMTSGVEMYLQLNGREQMIRAGGNKGPSKDCPYRPVGRLRSQWVGGEEAFVDYDWEEEFQAAVCGSRPPRRRR